MRSQASVVFKAQGRQALPLTRRSREAPTPGFGYVLCI
jgi:hypothetical protein